MYTIDCEDPNCIKCKQASKAQSSEEGNRSKIPETVGQSSEEGSRRQLQKTVEEVIAKDLLFAAVARRNCLSTCNGLKEEVHYEINALINILRERELDLCIEIEKDYSAQVLKIDHDVTASCVDKIMKRYDENKRPLPKTTLVFNSDFDALKRRLKCFGKLRYENTEEVNKKWIQELREASKWAWAKDALSSGCSFEVDSKPASKTKKAALVSSASPVKVATIAEHRMMNEVKLQEIKQELEEQNCRLNKISLESEEDSKFNFKDELSVDLGTLKLKEIRHEVDEPLEDRRCTLQSAVADFDEHFEAFNESLQAIPRFMLQKKTEPKVNEEDSKFNFMDELTESGKTMSEEEKRRRYRLKLQLLQDKEREFLSPLWAPKKTLQVFANRTRKDQKREEMAYRGFESTDSVPNKEVGMDSSSKRKLELVAEILKKEPSAGEIIRRSYGKDGCKIKTLHQQITGKDEPETLSAQIRKRFEVLANRTVKDQKRVEMAYQSFERTDSVPDKENGKVISSLKDLEELLAKLPVTDLKKDEITSESCESTDSSSSEEVEKDSSLDEDDIEIISRIETESIPSELSFSPPLPPKNRFKFGGKPSCFGSLLRKKGDRKPPHSPRNSSKSKSSGIGESDSQESSLGSAVSSGSNAEVKEKPSFNEQPDQESSSQCLGASKDEGRDIDPTVALRSSFTKYLEKNPESEWLAPHKSSEQSLSAGNSGKERVMPIFVQEIDQWLPRECNQKMASDWLYPARM